MIACSRHAYIFLFLVYIPFVVNHTINAKPPEKLQQHPLLFTTNHTDRMFFVWRLNSARPPHPGHNTIFLRSEIPSGMCAQRCHLWCYNITFDVFRSFFDAWCLRNEFDVEKNVHIVRKSFLIIYQFSKIVCKFADRLLVLR